MTHLLIARHGQTAYNLERRFLGQTDVPLNQRSELQAQALALRVTGEPISAVVSSDLARAYDTALAIAQPHSLTALRDPDLREIKMGAWEGKSFFEVEAQDARLFAHWRTDPTLSPSRWRNTRTAARASSACARKAVRALPHPI